MYNYFTFASLLCLLLRAADQSGVFAFTLNNNNGVTTIAVPLSTTSLSAVSVEEDLTFTVPDTEGILEKDCIDTASRMQRVMVPVSNSVSIDEKVGISYAFWPAEKRSSLPPVVLVHGFDSSCLEYRRIGSKLAARGINTYAVDILGWGFTKLNNVESFSASSKIEALNSFINSVVVKGNEKCVIAGASLGGASAIELAAAATASTDDDEGNDITSAVSGLILIDAQGFVDGIGPMASLPKPLAKLGVNVLKSVPLRSSANQMSYFDKEKYATDDAVVIGRLHCIQQPENQWNDAMVSFMQSGGFTPSKKVPKIDIPTLVLWGRQDNILDGTEFATKFVETIKAGKAELQWIEECGHVPHLEQPEKSADVILQFIQEKVAANNKNNVGDNNNPLSDVVGKLQQLFQ